MRISHGRDGTGSGAGQRPLSPDLMGEGATDRQAEQISSFCKKTTRLESS